ncbi:MAG: hypothetical protein NZM26_01410, partial [Patescibacteria group bacterium]|nr:hypothetical protein [Patescibacteria group bacterium]
MARSPETGLHNMLKLLAERREANQPLEWGKIIDFLTEVLNAPPITAFFGCTIGADGKEIGLGKK